MTRGDLKEEALEPAGDWDPARARTVTRDNRTRIAVGDWAVDGFVSLAVEDRPEGVADADR